MNTRGKAFANISSISGVDFPDDGRAIAFTDWDHDGDLDMWIVNRSGPQIRFLRNQAHHGYHHLTLRLRGTSCSRDAIGARVTLKLRDQPPLMRTLRAGDAFLAQSTKWLHFGLGDAKEVESLVVRWPTGETESFLGVVPGHRHLLVQGTGRAERLETPRRAITLESAPLEVTKSTAISRMFLAQPVVMPDTEYSTPDGAMAYFGRFAGHHVLVNLWASRCLPCRKELADFARHQQRLQDAGVQVLAISLDELNENGADRETVGRLLDSVNFPFHRGWATPATLDKVQLVNNFLLHEHRPLPVPCSVLLDRHGRAVAIYKGRIGVDQVIADVQLSGLDWTARAKAALPFEGRWHALSGPPRLLRFVRRLCEAGYLHDSVRLIERYRAVLEKDVEFAKLLAFVGTELLNDGQLSLAEVSLRQAIAVDADLAEAHFNLAVVAQRLGREGEFQKHVDAAVAGKDPPASALYLSAKAHQEQGDLAGTVDLLRQALEVDPFHLQAKQTLSWILATTDNEALRNGPEAIRWAKELIGIVGNESAGALDTLAAAYAAAGRFDEAVQTIQKALAMDTPTQVRTRLQQRLQLYQQRQPFIEK